MLKMRKRVFYLATRPHRAKTEAVEAEKMRMNVDFEGLILRAVRAADKAGF